MKRTRLFFSVLALLTGVGSAWALNAQPAADQIYHDWIDWNGQTILYSATQTQAQGFCSPSIDVCLRAKDNVLIYTSGYLPW
ncbi:hypothetical protein [Chitinophaga pinensis]|uniref:Uncharacterized protein n=1 Tax=Chitinophaga pinensis (strain ATCC 43595 / DSM 2588 / LMG 13176 / NBRC 15968 / NCIMB 11800 / UQM 2034) TaxID=485918 RepID=A0A979G4H4_CHIPD|nr:hypothetical protein [Chitinophaga pinensis]ACU60675.1 hypothetical protein Cpin_3208 [Chitinophaga pinensis DSM 2588]